jgi:hypothetical protein
VRLPPGQTSFASTSNLAFVDEYAHKGYHSAIEKHDEDAIEHLVAGHQLFRMEAGTPLLVVCTNINWSHVLSTQSKDRFIRSVRILGGEHNGKTAWVHDGAVTPERIKAQLREP